MSVVVRFSIFYDKYRGRSRRYSCLLVLSILGACIRTGERMLAKIETRIDETRDSHFLRIERRRTPGSFGRTNLVWVKMFTRCVHCNPLRIVGYAIVLSKRDYSRGICQTNVTTAWICCAQRITYHVLFCVFKSQNFFTYQ